MSFDLFLSLDEQKEQISTFRPIGKSLNGIAANQAWRFPAGLVFAILCALANVACGAQDRPTKEMLAWKALPPIPDELGVAGPFAGIHDDVLIVAGGANFPLPVWENEKVWLDRVYVLDLKSESPEWIVAGSLPRPIAYGAAVSTPEGVVCIGGANATSIYRDVFRLRWDRDSRELVRTELPPLPEPRAYGSATMVGDTVWFSGGQGTTELVSAKTNLWSLNLSVQSEPGKFVWEKHEPCPGPPRALHLTAAQHNGFDNCVYVVSGRNQSGDDVGFLRDTWEYNTVSHRWRKRADAPDCVMAGTAISLGQSHIFVLGGADEELFFRGDELKDEHPGFPKQSLAYHTITDTWTVSGTTPQNQVTTIAMPWKGGAIVPSGELRPRVRTPNVWHVTPIATTPGFGALNYSVLFVYLLAMVGVGVWFAHRNRSTDDFFRGGKQIPWWAAGCSIFATMLSSLTFTGIPAKAFAQDWVYAVGNFMIPVVAVIAVYVALPFFRRIDVTSAYEYLELRFNRAVRLFGSASFSLFHVFRMAVVMSLTGLALAVATPLTPAQSVLLMGTLSIVYCTMGGIEAVIWTDTIQTVVLLGGALVGLIFLIGGIDGGFGAFTSVAIEQNKFNMANLHWDASAAQIALWVVVAGSIAQNISSYTADQAVVQRYMTTSSEKLAARSIWTNAVLTIPATLLFFGIGTALFAFYRSHPERLDATITTDQIFPMFIARELPAGLGGLIVAGIFAAAQSTVSTSMNSTATAIVIDFLRPFNVFKTDNGYLWSARILTFVLGVVGTMLGLVFVDPAIKSLFDTFIMVIGLFMGVLGGLFVLGALTRRANGPGALTGAVTGAIVMFLLWKYSTINGYLYTACGITTCVLIGYGASLLFGGRKRDLTGLTIHTLSGNKQVSAQIGTTR